MVEAPFELGEHVRDMLSPHGAIGAGDSALYVAEDGFMAVKAGFLAAR